MAIHALPHVRVHAGSSAILARTTYVRTPLGTAGAAASKGGIGGRQGATDSQHRLNKGKRLADVPSGLGGPDQERPGHARTHARTHAGAYMHASIPPIRDSASACTRGNTPAPRQLFREEHAALGADPGAKQRGPKFPPSLARRPREVPPVCWHHLHGWARASTRAALLSPCSHPLLFSARL